MKMQAIAGWCGIPAARMVIPAADQTHDQFKTIAVNAWNIGQYRHALTTKLGYTNAQRQAVGTKNACYDLLVAACPHFP